MQMHPALIYKKVALNFSTNRCQGNLSGVYWQLKFNEVLRGNNMDNQYELEGIFLINSTKIRDNWSKVLHLLLIREWMGTLIGSHLQLPCWVRNYLPVTSNDCINLSFTFFFLFGWICQLLLCVFFSFSSSHADDSHSLGDILAKLSAFIPNDKPAVQIIIHRRRLLSSVLRATQDPDFSFWKPIEVVFAGEEAQDGGGPKREFFKYVFLSSLGRHLCNSLIYVSSNITQCYYRRQGPNSYKTICRKLPDFVGRLLQGHKTVHYHRMIMSYWGQSLWVLHYYRVEYFGSFQSIILFSQPTINRNWLSWTKYKIRKHITYAFLGFTIFLFCGIIIMVVKMHRSELYFILRVFHGPSSLVFQMMQVSSKE